MSAPALQTIPVVPAATPDKQQQTQATQTTAITQQASKKLGRFQEWKEQWFGQQDVKLEEDTAHVHWLPVAYMILMSIFAVQVFAMQFLQQVFTPGIPLGTRAVAVAWVVAIMGAVGVSDYAAPKGREVARLARLRGEFMQAFSLQAFAVSVYCVDAYTVFASLLQAEGMPNIVPDGKLVEVILRVYLIGATGWFIHTVTQKQYPTESTLARKGAETTGGALIKRITQRDADEMTTGELVTRFKAFIDAMSHQQEEHKFLFWTIGKKMDDANWKKLEEVLMKGTTKVSAMETELIAMIKNMSTMMQELMEMVATGSMKRSNQGPAQTKEADPRLAAVQELEVALLPAPSGKRGKYILSKYIEKLSDGKVKGDAATELAKSLGGGAMRGKSYIAPVFAVLAELESRNKLHKDLVDLQKASGKNVQDPF